METDEMEETFKRISESKDIRGVVIMTNEGGLIRHTMDEEKALKYARLAVVTLQSGGRVVAADGSSNQVANLRVDTNTELITICPGADFALLTIRESQLRRK
eukprot:TRINITY_DN57391_c0_g1_i1.p4 TRINITY_DN57391_c0_g1~~TRINITY_DN57391_c0_g1_i1.p4  ORF type:complete len:102 (+),score=36.70 TRINITY_DN57391_c0_g1_i1:95-400(+)